MSQGPSIASSLTIALGVCAGVTTLGCSNDRPGSSQSAAQGIPHTQVATNPEAAPGNPSAAPGATASFGPAAPDDADSSGAPRAGPTLSVDGQPAALAASDGATTDDAPITVAPGAFSDFSPNAGVSDVAVAPDAPLAYVVEATGTLRVLDIGADAPRLLRAARLFEEPVGSGRALGRLAVVRPDLALLPTRGPGFEGVAVFDPRQARRPADVTWIDLGGLQVEWPAETRDSQGADVSGRPLPVAGITAATVSAGRLVVCAANPDADGDHRPGVVALLPFDPAARAVGDATVLRTSAWNPTGLTRLATRAGERVLVTCTGSLGLTGGAVDVVDPAAGEVLGSIPFPRAAAGADPYGPVRVSPNGARGYVGSLYGARVHTVALDRLQAALAAGEGLAALRLADIPVETRSARNGIHDVALSGDGRTLYATNGGDGALHVIDLADPDAPVRVDGFARSGDPGAYEGLVGRVVVRPGAGDAGGDSLLTVTTRLVPQDRLLPGVHAVMDRVDVRPR